MPAIAFQVPCKPQLEHITGSKNHQRRALRRLTLHDDATGNEKNAVDLTVNRHKMKMGETDMPHP